MKQFLTKTTWVLTVIGLLTYPAHGSGQVVTGNVSPCHSAASSNCKDSLAVSDSPPVNPRESGDAIDLRILKTRTLVEQGKFTQALAEIMTLQKVANTKEGSTRRGEILNLAGAINLAAGSYANADVALREATEVARETKDARLLGRVLNNRAILMEERNDSRNAFPVIKEALATAEGSGDIGCASKVCVTYANALLDVGDNESADKMMALAHEKFLALPPSKDRSKGLAAVGNWYLQLSEAVTNSEVGTVLDKARSAYADALQSALQQHDTTISSYASGNLGKAEEIGKQYDDGLRHTRAAIFYAQQSMDASNLLYLWQWQAARILRAQGLREQAIALNRLAVQTLQANKPSFTGSDFDSEIKPVYLDLADLLLARASTMQEGPQLQGTLREVLQTIELLRSDELKDYLGDACLPANVSGSGSQAMAAKRLARVHYLVLGERIEVLVETSAGITRASVAAPVSEISNDAWALQDLIQERDDNYIQLSRKLYDLLIRPIHSAIAGSSTVVIVPDGVVRTIPIAALNDGTKYMIEKHALAMAQVDVVTGISPAARDKNVLLAGISSKVPGFPRIPFVDQELDDIHQLYGGVVLKNQAFTVSSLSDGMKDNSYQVLHVASHGVFADDISQSYILTWDGKLRMEELGSIVSSSKNGKAPLDLMVLSACSTAAGDERAPLGLAGVAVKAGAGSVIASLWDVDDEATAWFYDSFYRILKQNPSLSKAEAVRQAQLQMLQEKAGVFAGHGAEQRNGTHAAPFYWAPFVLVTGSI